MTPEQIRIWNYFVANAQGMNQAIHIADIAQAIGVPPNGTNNDNVKEDGLNKWFLTTEDQLGLVQTKHL